MLDGSGKELLRPQQSGLPSLFSNAQSFSHSTARSQLKPYPHRNTAKAAIAGPPGASSNGNTHPAQPVHGKPSKCLLIPIPLPPSIPTAVSTRSRCQDSSELHCPGQASAAATPEEIWTPNKTGKAKETPRR